jgi:Fungal specific transcription factor domain
MKCLIMPTCLRERATQIDSASPAVSLELQPESSRKRRRASSSAGRSAINTSELSTVTSTEPEDKSAMLVSLDLSVRDVALVHFLNDYIPGSRFEYLPKMLNSGCSQSCLLSTASAAAMANLARDRHDGQVMQMARKFYVKAIRDVFSALRTKEVDSDSTLAAILLLSIFELLILKDFTQTWMAHIMGAVSLIRFRGPELLSTAFGKRTVIMITHLIFVNCMQLKLRVPPALSSMIKAVSPFLTENHHPLVPYWSVFPHEVMFLAACPDLFTNHAMKIIQLGVDQHERQVRLMKHSERLLTPLGLSFDCAPVANIFTEIAETPHALGIVRFITSVQVLQLVRCDILHQQADLVLDYHSSESATEVWTDFQKTLKTSATQSAQNMLDLVPFYHASVDPESPLAGGIKIRSLAWLIWPLANLVKAQIATVEQRAKARQILRQIGQRDVQVEAMVANSWWRKESKVLTSLNT